MQMQLRRGPNGLEVFYGDRWQAVGQDWVDARKSEGHTFVEQPASSVQGGVNPQVFAADGAQLSGNGTIVNRPATSVQGGVNPGAFTADGATLSGNGNIVSRPGEALPMPGVVPPQSRPNDTGNPLATYNAATGNWNVDPADAWARPAAPAAAAPVATAMNRPPEDYTGALPLPTAASMGVTPEYFRDYYRDLGAQRFAAGGRIADYAEGGMTPEEPNAIVGEGPEGMADTGEGNEFALEAVWEPTGAPGTFRGYWAEGPVTATLKPGTLIHPIAKQHEQLFRDELLPITSLKQPAPKAGAGGEAALPLPPAPEPLPEYAMGGRVPEEAPMSGAPSLVPQAALQAAPNQKPAEPYARGW